MQGYILHFLIQSLWTVIVMHITFCAFSMSMISHRWSLWSLMHADSTRKMVVVGVAKFIYECLEIVNSAGP